ncbi:MAG: hypothetical protein BWY87_01236 [Deltaproteobacteria bacterium ADurb.Bin510]|nr:MAG: hypothetical protein BWY87_01236 [Deltaproteobacteria bacterium ADurb.Bin510]
MDVHPLVVDPERWAHVGEPLLEGVPDDVPSPTQGEGERLGQAEGAAVLLVPTSLGLWRRALDPPFDRLVLVVVEDQGPFAFGAVDVAVGALLNGAVSPEVEDLEVVDATEEVSFLEQREDPLLMLFHQILVGPLIPIGAAVLHAVLLPVPLHLAVAEHRQARHGDHQGRDTEILVALAELDHGRLLVGVVHEVDETPQDLGVELEDVLDHVAVLAVLLGLEHVHEGAVVDPMHAQASDEVTLHQPEGLGQKQGVGRLDRDAVDQFAPELVRK